MKKLILMAALLLAQNTFAQALDCSISTVQTDDNDSKILWQGKLEENIFLVQSGPVFQELSMIDESEVGRMLDSSDGSLALTAMLDPESGVVNLTAGYIRGRSMETDFAAAGSPGPNGYDQPFTSVTIVLLRKGIAFSCY